MFVKFENSADHEEILNTSRIRCAFRKTRSGTALRDAEIVEIELLGGSWSSVRMAEWRKLLPNLNVVLIVEPNGNDYWLSIDAIQHMWRWRAPQSWQVQMIEGGILTVPDSATPLILSKLKTVGLDDVTKSPAAA